MKGSTFMLIGAMGLALVFAAAAPAAAGSHYWTSTNSHQHYGSSISPWHGTNSVPGGKKGVIIEVGHSDLCVAAKFAIQGNHYTTGLYCGSNSSGTPAFDRLVAHRVTW